MRIQTLTALSFRLVVTNISTQLMQPLLMKMTAKRDIDYLFPSLPFASTAEKVKLFFCSDQHF